MCVCSPSSHAADRALIIDATERKQKNAMINAVTARKNLLYRRNLCSSFHKKHATQSSSWIRRAQLMLTG